MQFTAVFLKVKHGYVGFVEELPIVNSHGATLDEARRTLRKLVALVFDAERQSARELVAGRELVRQTFAIALPAR
jgi:predicted RNase H-like HicB family nuclease